MRNLLPVVLLCLCLVPVVVAIWLSWSDQAKNPDADLAIPNLGSPPYQLGPPRSAGGERGLAIPNIGWPPYQPGWFDYVRSLLP
jgi:hypothetical protein